MTITANGPENVGPAPGQPSTLIGEETLAPLRACHMRPGWREISECFHTRLSDLGGIRINVIRSVGRNEDPARK